MRHETRAASASGRAPPDPRRIPAARRARARARPGRRASRAQTTTGPALEVHARDTSMTACEVHGPHGDPNPYYRHGSTALLARGSFRPALARARFSTG